MAEASSESLRRATSLYVELSGDDIGEEIAGQFEAADGLVFSCEDRLPEPVDGMRRSILRGIDPALTPKWRERPNTAWVATGGLDAALNLRDAWPDLDWVPYAEIYRPEVRFDFRPASPGEGFSMYIPDTAAIQGFRLADAQRDSLESWLAQLGAEGFRTLWLHSRDAETRGVGGDIELLHRARRHFAGGRIWLSGGVADPRHLKTLAIEGGAKAAVVPAALARDCGCAALIEALALDPTPAELEVASAGCPQTGSPE